jgi:hypothetical protein
MAGFSCRSALLQRLDRTSTASIFFKSSNQAPRHTATLASHVLRAICHADAAKFRARLRHRAIGGELGVTGLGVAGPDRSGLLWRR